jgi:hypothetical protein
VKQLTKFAMQEAEEQGAGVARRDISSLPLDVLAGPSLLGCFRLARLAMFACVSRRMREAAIAAGARHTAVSLAGPLEAEDASVIVSLLKRLPALTALDLAGSREVVSACLQALFSDETELGRGSARPDGSDGDGACSGRGTYLSCLTCLRTSGVVDAGILETALTSCGLLRALGLRNCAVTDKLVSCFAPACPFLQSVDLSNTATGDYGVSLLALHCDLREVALRACPITDDSLHSLALGARELEVLDIGWCKEVTDKGILRITSQSHTASCQHLKNVNLSKCTLSYKAIRAVAQLQGLEKLSAAGLHGLQGEAEEIETFRLLAHCSSLTSIDVSVPIPPWTVGDRAIAALCSHDRYSVYLLY